MKTYGRSMGLGFALAFAMLCGIGAMEVRGAYLMEDTAIRVNDSHDLLRRVSGLLGALTAVETAQRGYLLSSDTAQLPVFEAAVQDMQGWLAGLRGTPGFRSGSVELDEIERRIGALVVLYRERIVAREGATLEMVMRDARVADGRRRMADVRQRLQAIDTRESAELAARNADMAGTTRTVKLVSGAGVLLSLLTLVAVWVALQRLLTRSVGGAAEDVLRQSRDLEIGSRQQAAINQEAATATVQLTTTMHEVQAAADQIARRAAEVEEIARASSQAAGAGGQSVARARETVTAMREQIDRVVAHMLGLVRKVQGAESVLETVEELAERTNILAINATIEAASAGRDGERFQVVADEIRRLAERMRVDAVQIRSQLDDIRNASNATVMATETGSKSVAASAALFEEIDAALRRIVERVATSESATQEIRLSTHQQSTAVLQLESALSEVSRATGEAELSAQRTLGTAASLAGTAHRLRDFVTPQRRFPWQTPRPAGALRPPSR